MSQLLSSTGEVVDRSESNQCYSYFLGFRNSTNLHCYLGANGNLRAFLLLLLLISLSPWCLTFVAPGSMLITLQQDGIVSEEEKFSNQTCPVLLTEKHCAHQYQALMWQGINQTHFFSLQHGLFW